MHTCQSPAEMSSTIPNVSAPTRVAARTGELDGGWPTAPTRESPQQYPSPWRSEKDYLAAAFTTEAPRNGTGVGVSSTTPLNATKPAPPDVGSPPLPSWPY